MPLRKVGVQYNGPTAQASNTEKDDFYIQLSTIYDKTPTYIFGATPVYRVRPSYRNSYCLSCGACKPEQTLKDLLIKVDVKPLCFHDL